MNYFAHGLSLLDDPYVLVGAAAPDLLRVSDRESRVRRRAALPWVDHDDPRVAAVARGIVRHHDDDGWFHQTGAFNELCYALTAQVRDHLAAAAQPDPGMRPSFLGHILVELLLDAALIDEEPRRLEAYYQALGQVDPAEVQRAVNLMATAPARRLAWFIPAFLHERFLWDYRDDAKLWGRLNQVLRRVGLPPLPESFRELFPQARAAVIARRDALLTPEPDARPAT